jgi:hypothetical protein
MHRVLGRREPLHTGSASNGCVPHTMKTSGPRIDTRVPSLGMLRAAGFVFASLPHQHAALHAGRVRRALKKFGVGRGTDVKPLPGFVWIDQIFAGIGGGSASLGHLHFRSGSR